MKILIADEQPLFRDALRRLLAKQSSISSLREVGHFSELCEQLNANPKTQYLFMDVPMSGNSGLSGITLIKNDYPQLQIVAVSATQSPMVIYRALKLGAAGFIPKTSSAEEFEIAIGQILAGNSWIPRNLNSGIIKQPYQNKLPASQCHKSECLSEKIASLSPRQFKVLSMISDGQLNKQIAYELDLQEGTIKHHVSLILQKLNVVNRTGAANLFNRLQVEKRLNG